MDDDKDQYRKPYGERGIEIIQSMNEEHKNISEFAFECIDVDDDAEILDIGCGGGVNIEKFHRLTSGNVDGLDYSEVSVAQTIKRNSKHVESGKCKVIHADVTDMPIEDETYNLVTAFSTIFFWPDIVETFREVLRIIKPGGQFMIAQGTDGTNPTDADWVNPEEGLNVYNAYQLERYLLEAGFNSVDVFTKENTYLLAVIGKK